MKTVEEIKKILEEHKNDIKKKFHLKSIGIFGSYVRGDATETSDLDILVEFERPIGLEFVDLADYLENLLGVKVDLVSRGAIRPKMWTYVKGELVYV